MLKQLLPLLIYILLIGFIFSCNKEEFTTSPNANLEFSIDTLSFDTVFTTLGSTTKWLRVKNPNSRAVNISSVYLAEMENSPFRLNINGVESNKETNVLIPARDSIFIFVEVTIDPTGVNNPMIIQDSIIFNLNGNTRDVKLLAFGQDFHLFDGDVLKSQNWKNDKPYLIYNSILVDSLETLNIDAGCRIHFHKASSMFVKGTLLVNGTFEEPVYFQGDRLEDQYNKVPGQWGAWKMVENGIYVYGGIHLLQGSTNNNINYTIIKNAGKGIQIDSLGNSADPVLTLNNSIIKNMTVNCLDARTTFIKASNCIFSNSGSYSVALRFGGDYEFNHCTVANYFTGNSRKEPALILNNYFAYNKQVYSFDFEAMFGNCIIYGNLGSELVIDKAGGGKFDYLFKNCLIKTNANPENPGGGFIGSIFNTDPLFSDVYEHNYELDSLSPARDIGDVEIAKFFSIDLNANSRLEDKGPDLGALEWIPKNK